MRDSIFFAAVRSFFVALSVIIGLSLGLLLIGVLIGALSTTTEGTPDINYTYTPEIVPNADNVRKAESGSAPVILKINIDGIIGTELLNMNTIRQQLIESRERAFKDGLVKGLILYINSPGGTVTDADGIYRALKNYKELYKVPVYAYVDGLCASGGMYVAASADKIFASDSSLVGSIGVLSPSFMNFTGFINELGIKALTLTAGKGKDEMNPLRPWSPGEQDALQDIINEYYNMFVNIIVTNRKEMNKDKLVEDYGAHVFLAKTAKDYGYIDETGHNFESTLKALLNHLGIEDNYYQVVQFENKTWLSELISGNFDLLKGQIKHKVVLSPDMDPELMNKFLYLYRLPN